MFGAAFSTVGHCAGMTLPHADGSRARIGSIEDRLMADRAPHIAIDRQARIKEEHPAELDVRCRHVIGRNGDLRKPFG
jgi:hypothetical protein